MTVSKSDLDAKFQYMSLKRNFVSKRGDEIQNVYTFKNTGSTKKRERSPFKRVDVMISKITTDSFDKTNDLSQKQ